MSKEELMKNLETFPEEIRKSETELSTLSRKMSNLGTENKKIEGAVLAAISREEDRKAEMPKKEGETPKVTVKKKFPNDIARNHELNNRLVDHKEYNENQTSLTYLKKMFEEEKVKLNFYNNSFSATKYMVRLICGRDD